MSAVRAFEMPASHNIHYVEPVLLKNHKKSTDITKIKKGEINEKRAI